MRRHTMSCSRANRPGFSLLELVVVVAILGVLVGVLMSAVQAARGAASRAQCQSNLRQLALAAMNQESSTQHFPPKYLHIRIPGTTKLRESYPWPAQLLPQLEQSALWTDMVSRMRVDPPYRNPPHTGLATVVKAFVCPSDSRLNAPIRDDEGNTAAYCSYVGIYGDRVDMKDNRSRFEKLGIISSSVGTRISEVTDGLSQTILFSESPPPGRWLLGTWYLGELPFHELWTARPCRKHISIDVRYDTSSFCRGPFLFAPGRLENLCDTLHLWSLHSGGANFAFADGSVRYLPYSAVDVLPALATRAGGEVADAP